MSNDPKTKKTPADILTDAMFSLFQNKPNRYQIHEKITDALNEAFNEGFEKGQVHGR